MGLLGLILAAVLVAVLIAFVIVKYLPLKLRWIASIGLLFLAVFLGMKIYNGIMQPINFNKDKVQRYSNVVRNLKIIRDAEVKYYEANGSYTKDKNLLIMFIDSSSLALTVTNTIVKTVNRGGGITDEIEVKVTDTIGYETVLKYFKNRDYKNMFKVPGLEEIEFSLEVGTVEKVQGLLVPTFMAKTPKQPLLAGMNESLVKQEIEQLDSDQIKGEFVSVGSLEEVTTAGNWPPSYDKSDKKE
ncbi:hypothetical protein PI23P_12727 [Polaribacter irgensii 23-P]|uniref:Uncharacterized protein n=1 Tax=Polaribacter irgensii 23-P TaxID=313594 RepID=A4C248_9FLAO|nr:hypothetical protein [Polaribacter irgensii]EAR12201.1 hypothetical protein PI23P_12727 [Polaribacter irgensii 23-P]